VLRPFASVFHLLRPNHEQSFVVSNMLSGKFGRAAVLAMALTCAAIGPVQTQSDVRVSNVFFQPDLRQTFEVSLRR
jgi:hypothetical protein